MPKKVLSCPKLWPKVVSSVCVFISRHLTTEALDLNHVSFSTAGRSSSQPPLVILHGVLTTMDPWKTKATAIHEKTGRTVITVDARNHGRSPYSPQHTYKVMVSDIVRLIKKLGLPKVSVIGHSMGGRAAMSLALLHPDLISSMIVIDVSPESKTKDDIKIKFWNILNVMSKMSIRSGITMTEARNYVLEHLILAEPNANPKSIAGVIHQNLIQRNDGVYTWLFNVHVIKEHLSIIHSFPTELEDLRYCGPSLFVAGTKSDYIGQNGLAGIQRFFPMAELVFVEGAGHNLPFQKEKEFLQITCEFLAKS